MQLTKKLIELIKLPSAYILACFLAVSCFYLGFIYSLKEIENIIDPRLQSYNINSAWRAMACLPSLAVQRPDISYVYDELKECLKMEMASD